MSMDADAQGMATRALQKFEPFFNFSQTAGKVKRVAVVGDSFVGGGGVTAPLTFAIPMAAALRARYGDAGSGYIPWANGKMTGYGHSANFLQPSSTPSSSSFTAWTDVSPFHAKAFNGLGSYRTGGVGGTDGNESVSYTPNVADSFARGVTDTVTYVAVYFTLHSANSGFVIRQSDQSQVSGTLISNGASFTASTSGTVLTASAVTGLIPRAGVAVTGGVSAGTIITSFNTGSGGAGTYNISASQTVASTAMTVVGNASAAVGVPQMILHRYDPVKSQTLQVLGVYGDVEVHGVETYNGNAGVAITDFGQGSTTAYQWSSLDDASQRVLWQLAAFDQVMVVLGMNDRTYFEPALYGNSIAALVSRIQACQRSKVLLVRQTDASDAGSTYQQYYDVVLQNVASAMGCGYIDERTCPGFATYTAANSNGYMTDGVHRNGTGNTLIGNFHASRFTL